ncbi:MAG: sodium/glutamate symporter [Bacteroidales bacterium]|nr:sodium/glutamate symporter [Bacteroidales bacterium]
MEELTLDMYQSAGVGVAALLVGMWLTRKVPFLKRYCIPAPVSGGLLVSLLTLGLYLAGGVACRFDGTVKDICMMAFFTSVGFQSDIRVLRTGGRPLLVMLLLVTVLIMAQNFLSVGIAAGLGRDPLFGMAAGSIPMCGGHGTAGGFAPLLEELGLPAASSVTMAAATFGLVAGSLLGGPLAGALIRRRRLAEPGGEADAVSGIEASDASPESRKEYLHSDERSFRAYLYAACLILLAMALGSCLSRLLARTGITFPTYFGSLLVAVLLRNTLGRLPRWADRRDVGKITSLGDICLSLFLGMAMSSLRLWELSSMALPLCLILLAQVVFMAVFAVFVAFPLLGRDYEGAVYVAGLCGFGLGATPNAMANMSAVCFKYRYTVNPFIVVPLIGAMFVDIINTTVVTLFLNLIH